MPWKPTNQLNDKVLPVEQCLTDCDFKRDTKFNLIKIKKYLSNIPLIQETHKDKWSRNINLKRES